MIAPNVIIGQRYKVIRLLGQGGMSNLYLCQDVRTPGQVWVIKEMTARYSDPKEQEQALHLFQREAQLLRSLNHRHIPKVVDNFQFQGKYYLVMEYVDGEDLGKKIERAGGPLPEKQVVDWGIQVATVLYYLHCHKPPIVFRDVKPSNVMITSNIVKLIDFGIARSFNPNKKGDTMRIGSPGYAPPEQYSGQTDPRSDIYALGVTLHHALTGRDPTVTQTPFLVPPARSLNPRISEEVAASLQRATQLDPDKRYQSIIEMKRDLQAAQKKLQGGTQVVGPPGSQAGPAPSAVPVAAPPAAGVAAAGAQPVAAAAGQSPVQVPPGAVAPGQPPQAVGAPAQAGPAAGQPPAGQTAAPAPRRKRFPVMAALVTFFLAASLIAGIMVPHVVTDGRDILTDLWIRIVAQPPPSDPADAGGQLYRNGGDLMGALAYLEAARRRDPGDGRLQVLYQNALAEATGRKLSVVAAVVPEDGEETVRGLALSQYILNSRGGVQGELVVLDLATYSSGRSPEAIAAAAAGRAGRKMPDGARPPKLLLVWADAEEAAAAAPALGKAAMPVQLVSPAPPQPAISHLTMMPAAADGAATAVAASLPKGSAGVVWLSQEFAPESSGLKVDRASPPTDPAGAATLLAQHKGKMVVAAASDTAALAQAALAAGTPLIVLAWLGDQLPDPSTIPPGSIALVRFSNFAASPLASEFALGYPVLFQPESVPALAGSGNAFDALAYGLHVQGSPGRVFQGAQLVVNEEGKARPADWYRFRHQNGRWVFDQGVQLK
ncbi:MAG: serine/threonine protein kinase [Armatimonadetes bacterium]|nr:serine/threonine protein kinase [Armatimonadota bacterium]